MFNWFAILFNSFWIIGAAVLLATVSYHRWLAVEANLTLSQQFQTENFLRPFWLSLLLINIGLIGTSQQWWEASLWSLFLLYSLVNIWIIIKRQS